MDKKELFEKAEKALNQAFDTARKSVKVVAEKAGEAAEVTKLLMEKAALEHRVTKQLTRLGSCVYEKSSGQGRASFLEDPEIRNLVDETRKLESQLATVEASLEQGTREIKKFPKRRARS